MKTSVVPVVGGVMSESDHARVFISYSRQDGQEAAAQVREFLTANDIPVWQDIVALEGGRDWWSQISQTLRDPRLDHLVMILTPKALESRFVRDEIRLARQMGKQVTPLRGPGLNNLSKVPRWLGHVIDPNIPSNREYLLKVLKGPSTQSRVPMMAPEPPSDFVARDREFDALKHALIDPVTGDIAQQEDDSGKAVAITAALRGAGGYGKTTLAKALAHDPDILDAYLDGVLWVELGESPSNLIGLITDLVESLTGDRPGFEGLNAAAAALGDALDKRRILLIVDDVWREQDLIPFLKGGPNTTRLVTTRLEKVVPDNAFKQPVDAMADAEALSLLQSGLPADGLPAQEAALKALADRLGNWAQLLKLVNGFIRNRIKAGATLEKAIARADKQLTRKGLDSFSAANEADRTKTVALTISISVDLLPEDAKQRFGELAVFPEDEDVPISVLADLWDQTGDYDEDDTEELLLELSGLSLLLDLNLGANTFRLHDTTRHFCEMGLALTG